jgi:hypothetical protein
MSHHVPTRLGLVVAAAAFVACVSPRQPAPATPCPAVPSASVAPSSAAAASVAAPAGKQPMRPMGLMLGERECGHRDYTSSPGVRAFADRAPETCYGRLGCPDFGSPPRPGPCPELPVVSVEQIVRGWDADPDTRRPGFSSGPRELILTGTLTTHGASISPSLSERDRPACGARSRVVSLETLVDGTCYAADVFPLSCWGDASRTCCDYLPLGEAAAVVGNLSVDTYQGGFRAVLNDAKLCVLKRPTPPAGGAK